MIKSPQPASSHSLTESQLITIEMGLKWMSESQHSFARKLYDRLLLKHPEIRGPLMTTGFPTFQNAFLRASDALKLDFRVCRSIQTTAKEHWAIRVREFIPKMEREGFEQLAETFLEVLAEVVEDAWCPAVETAWRTAIRELESELVRSGKWGRPGV